MVTPQANSNTHRVTFFKEGCTNITLHFTFRRNHPMQNYWVNVSFARRIIWVAGTSSSSHNLSFLACQRLQNTMQHSFSLSSLRVSKSLKTNSAKPSTSWNSSSIRCLISSSNQHCWAFEHPTITCQQFSNHSSQLKHELGHSTPLFWSLIWVGKQSRQALQRKCFTFWWIFSFHRCFQSLL